MSTLENGMDTLEKISSFVLSHQEIFAGIALLLTVNFRYSWLISRTLLIAGGATTVALAPEPSLRVPYLWAYVACIFVLAMVFRRKKSPKLSRETEAYIAMNRAKLVAFYKEHAPEKISEVDTILEKYRGHETEMWQRLERKYKHEVSYAEDDQDDQNAPVSPPPTTKISDMKPTSRDALKSAARSSKRNTPRTPPPTPPSTAHRAPPPTPNSPPVVQQAREDARLAMQRRIEERLRRT